MARKLTPEEQAILRLYAAAEEKIVAHIARQLEKGLDAPDWAQVKQLELHETKRWIKGAPNPTARAQKKYTSLLDNAYRQTGSAALVRGKGDTQRQVLARIAHNTPLNLPNFQAVAMRTAEDVYRDVVRVGSAMTALGVESKKVAVRDAIKEFRSRGVTAFTDKKGRRWNIKTYTEMAVTTGTRNARRAGHLDRFAENGVDLVKVSTRPSSRRSGGKTCDRCKRWEGKILSITGQTEGYPTLKEAESDGLHHPRCGHTVSAYFPKEEQKKVEPVEQPDDPMAELRKLLQQHEEQKNQPTPAPPAPPKPPTPPKPKPKPKPQSPSGLGLNPRNRKEIKKLGFEVGEVKLPRVANPKRGQPGYQKNCSNCVVAYEFRRRGLKVTAAPRPKGRQNALNRLAWRVKANKPPAKIGLKVDRHIKDRVAAALQKNMPEGARGMISAEWSFGGAHIWNWEVKDGKAIFVESQVKDGNGETWRYWEYMKPDSEVSLFRVDNATFVSNIEDFVVKE